MTENQEMNTNNRLSNKGLWDKAATNEPITRKDIDIPVASNNSGLQSLNEGLNYLQFSDHEDYVYFETDEEQ